MILKTIREFHWLTKIVIALTGLLLGLLLVAAIVSLYWSSSHDPNAFSASQGLGMIVMSLGWILTQAFLVILVIVVIYLAATRIKEWIEKYLDAMLAKMDTLLEQKNIQEKSDARLVAMDGKMDEMQKKLANIERILEKVSE